MASSKASAKRKTTDHGTIDPFVPVTLPFLVDAFDSMFLLLYDVVVWQGASPVVKAIALRGWVTLIEACTIAMDAGVPADQTAEVISRVMSQLTGMTNVHGTVKPKPRPKTKRTR